MIKAMKFASIPVKDQQRALEFYTRKLGFHVTTDQAMGPGQRWIELGLNGGSGVALFTPQGHEDRVGTFSGISFVCDDAEKTHRTCPTRRRIHPGSEERVMGHISNLQGRRWQHVRVVVQVKNREEHRGDRRGQSDRRNVFLLWERDRFHPRFSNCWLSQRKPKRTAGHPEKGIGWVAHNSCHPEPADQ
jgi:catechol 2,3-dioxygenase-like lactoylglutathione lyase family enzyme